MGNGNKNYEGDPFLTLFTMLKSKVQLLLVVVCVIHFCVFQLLLKMGWNMFIKNSIKITFACVSLFSVMLILSLVVKSSNVLFRNNFQCSRGVKFVAAMPKDNQ